MLPLNDPRAMKAAVDWGDAVTDDERLDLIAKIDGLTLVLSVALNLLPDPAQVAERLRIVEEAARQRNAMTGTIEILRQFRENWQT